MSIPIDEGHICKKCGSERSEVYETRLVQAYAWRRIRRRRCIDCGARWVTVEVHMWDVVEHLQNE